MPDKELNQHGGKTKPINIDIRFDNWDEFQKSRKQTILGTEDDKETDPEKEDFDWMHWCGIGRETPEFKKKKQKYVEFCESIPGEFFEPSRDYRPVIKDYSSKMNWRERKCFNETLLNLQLTETKEYDSFTKDVLICIYKKEAENGRWYVVEEYNLIIKFLHIVMERIKYLQKTTNISDSIKTTSFMLYTIYNTCVVDSLIKDMIVPSLCPVGSKFCMFSEDKITPQMFFNWLISFLTIKCHEPTDLDTHPQLDDIFSKIIHRGWSIEGQPPLSDCPDEVFKKIFGDLLVSKDIRQWIAHIASFWTGAPKTDVLPIDNLNTVGPDVDDIYEIWNIKIDISDIYSFMNTGQFNCIYDYFKQKRTFEKLVLLCSDKSWKKGKKTKDNEVLFVFPKKFNRNLIWKKDCDKQVIQNNDEDDEADRHLLDRREHNAGGGRKLRRKGKTLKKSNRIKKRNRTIKK
jgi:hypothetical protein